MDELFQVTVRASDTFQGAPPRNFTYIGDRQFLVQVAADNEEDAIGEARRLIPPTWTVQGATLVEW